MLEKYNFHTLESIEKSLVFSNKSSNELLDNPKNVIIVSLDVKNLESIIEQLNIYNFEKNNIHLIYPGILEDDTQLFSLLNNILSESKCKLFILQNKFSDSKFLFEAADIANYTTNLQIFHNSLTKVKTTLDILNPKVFRSLVNIGISGHQQHLSGSINMDHSHFDSYRLGNILSQIEVLNKPIQYSDAVIADLSVLKQSELPSRNAISTSGITSEMFNQIARIAGNSYKTRVTVMSGLDEIQAGDAVSNDTIAQFIYYYISGASKAGINGNGEKLTNYVVDECLPYGSVTFIKNEVTLEWTVKYPGITDDNLSKYSLIPCSYQDFQYSGQGELSPRLLDIFKWLDDLTDQTL